MAITILKLDTFDARKPTVGLAALGQVGGTFDAMIRQFLMEYLPGYQMVVYGALDNLDARQLNALEREPIGSHDPCITTSLPGGRRIILAQSVFERLLQERLQQATAAGIRTSVLLCTTEFPGLDRLDNHIVTQPNHILTDLVISLDFAGPLGVAVPLKEQIVEAKKDWSSVRPAVVTSISLDSPVGAAIDAAATYFKAHQAGAVVLDCIEYSPALQLELHKQLDIPVLQAAATIGRALQATFN